ncbi:hypothetical protein ACH9DO_15405 [Kocuria sp. M1N1S27]|uniref:hypothetical protein n=1 Tax=Kocuria kalidii TaxID=3376283 RepID=UPI0037B7D593
MTRTTRTVVGASLALAVLTGCGGASAEARGSYDYEPLPPLSTATPTTSPAPQPTSKPAPTSSPRSSAEDSSDEAPAAGEAAPVGGTAGTTGAGIPGQGSALAPAPAPLAPVPAPVPGPVGGGTPVQVTERTSTSTTTTTSTTLEAGLMIVVTCDGLCVLGDLSSPELAGQNGPLSPDLLRQALEEELSRQGGDQQRLTDELVEQFLRGEWALTDRDLEGGDEKLVFSSARK